MKVMAAKLREMIPYHELRGSSWKRAFSVKESTLHFANGGETQFLSTEMKLSSYGGVARHYVWQDEHCPYSYFVENLARLVDYNGYLINTFTPEWGRTWEFDFFENPPPGVTVDMFKFWQEKNPFLDPEGVATNLAALSRDPVMLERKMHGEPGTLSGLVIPQFDSRHHIVPDRKIRKDAYRVFCIDMHTKTPCGMVWAAWEPNGKLIIYRTAKKAMTIPELQDFIRVQSLHDGKISLWLADCSEGGNRDATDIRGNHPLVVELASGPNGIPVYQVPKPKGSFSAGIYKLRSLFAVDPMSGDVDVEIFKSCDYPVEWLGDGKSHGSLPWELGQYAFRKETSTDEEILRENVIQVNEHLISCTRYIVMAGHGTQGKPIKSYYDKG